MGKKMLVLLCEKCIERKSYFVEKKHCFITNLISSLKYLHCCYFLRHCHIFVFLMQNPLNISIHENSTLFKAGRHFKICLHRKCQFTMTSKITPSEMIFTCLQEKEMQEQISRLQGELNDKASMCRYCSCKLDVHIGKFL